MPWRLSPFQLADVLAAERPGAKAGEMVDLASMLHIIDMAGDHVADCEGGKPLQGRKWCTTTATHKPHDIHLQLACPHRP